MRAIKVPDEESVRIRTVAILTPKQIARLDVLAQKRTMSRSLLIRLACDRFLAQEEEVTD